MGSILAVDSMIRGFGRVVLTAAVPDVVPQRRRRSWQNGVSPVKLRNVHLAVVERHKIVDYLLNSAHPDNGGKAHFFEALGFAVGATDLLIAALREIARTGEVVESVETSHGEKYVVDGSLSSQTDSSHSRIARTVWIIDRGFDAPRLVTAILARSETSG